MKRLLILLLTGLFAQLVVSCYPEGADNIEDYDVAITNYDKGADFSAFTTFSIPDTVVYFANDNSAGKPSHEFDDAVIKAVTDNFVAMGYEKVADPTATTPAEDLPSFIVTVSAFSNVNYAYFVDNWYNNWNWYWGGWWGGPFNPYYPWYPVSVYSYRTGSVVVDLAAATGGNCAYTEAGKVVTTENQVKIIGYTDFPSRLPTQSSQLYGTNLVNLLKLLCKEKDGKINIDFDDVVLRGVTVVLDGEEIPPAQIQVSAQPKQEAKAAQSAVKKEEEKPTDPRKKYGIMAAVGVGVLLPWLASVAPADFHSHFTVFVLACVVGYYVVWNVSHALHTPLMAVTNAISGIIIVGELLQIRQPTGNFFIDALAFVAILVASINIFGGFRVTQRMLAMFRKG